MANKFKVAKYAPREAPGLTRVQREALAPPIERLATWPGNGRLAPRVRKAIPVALLPAKSAKPVELPRGFVPTQPGLRLRKLTARLRLRARARLSPAFARAVKLIQWQIGRYGESAHDAEALAARFRQKEDMRASVLPGA